MDILELIKDTISVESKAVQNLLGQIDQSFHEAIDLLKNCQGKVVIVGIGKSGIIGKKIAASFSSTGTPSFFVHACEAVHGDSGMIEHSDVVILISNSGETWEVLDVLPILDQVGCKKICITSQKNSTLANNSNVALIYHYDREADHLNLAPTTSAVLALVVGDSLAVTLSKIKGFEKEDFHRYHPGGSLGAQLTTATDEGA